MNGTSSILVDIGTGGIKGTPFDSKKQLEVSSQGYPRNNQKEKVMRIVPKKVVRILRMPEVVRRTGASKSTVYSWIEQGKFPKGKKIGGRSVGWLESTVEEWILEHFKEEEA